jgi:polyisoprenoid-binding protein YceI
MSTYAPAPLSLLPAGRWQVDPDHTSVEFRVRHAGLARVRGVFEEFEGEVEVAADGTLRAHGSVATTSLNTRIHARDEHLRSPDFFDAEKHPRMTFRSTAIEVREGGFVSVRGDLTIRDVTREIELEGEILGSGRDDDGNERIGLELQGSLDRRHYGLTWNAAIDGGGLLVGNRVDLALEISAVRALTPR